MRTKIICKELNLPHAVIFVPLRFPDGPGYPEVDHAKDY